MAKVLHIDSERNWRGGQQQAAYLLEGLLAKGYKTALVCQLGSELEAYCKKNNLPCYGVGMRGEIDLFAAFKIAEICKRENFEILHLHSAHALATGLWVKLFLNKIKLVAVRRVDFPIKKNPLSRFKYTSPMVERHICISEAVKQVMLRYGIPKARLKRIYSGIDPKRFSDLNYPPDFKQSLGIPDHHLVVGTIAAVAGHKDYPNLLNAAKKVIDSYQNVTFCAVGSGPCEEEIQKLAIRLELGERFVFTGFRKDVGHFLKLFDVFVLSSSLEGLGTSVLDAQACGLPVIGCNSGGIPEMITNEVNGLLVPKQNSGALSMAIMTLLLDNKKRERFATAGKTSVEKFSVMKMLNEYRILYEQILNE